VASDAACCEAPCNVPTTTGYDFAGAGGTVTISGFDPTGVTCASGYEGTVSYTVCGSGGSDYSVSGCEEQSGYQYYKFNPTKTRSNSQFQVSEIAFRYQGVDVDVSAGSSTYDGAYGGGSPGNVFDEETGSKACCSILPVTYSFPEATHVDEFRFTTGDDMDSRDPIQWTLEGSHDNTNWVVLQTQDSDYACTTSRRTDSDWFPFGA